MRKRIQKIVQEAIDETAQTISLPPNQGTDQIAVEMYAKRSCSRHAASGPRRTSPID